MSRLDSDRNKGTAPGGAGDSPIFLLWWEATTLDKAAENNSTGVIFPASPATTAYTDA